MSWDKDRPLGTTKIHDADDLIRENNAALEDALSRNHNFPGQQSVDAGEHTIVTMRVQEDDPEYQANKGVYYTKNVDGIVEAFYRDSNGTIVQITDNGSIGGNLAGLKSSAAQIDTVAYGDTAKNSHTHDDRYYTESEIDTNFYTKSDIDADFYTKSDVYTKSEADARYGQIPSGTKMVFVQSSAPTGWTQDTSYNDRVIRVVSGVGGSTGGSWTISGLSQAAHNHTFTTPDHRHETPVAGTSSNYGTVASADWPYGKTSRSRNTYWSYSLYGGAYTYWSGPAEDSDTGTTSSASPSISSDGSWRPAYIDVIVCSKD